MNKIRNLTTQFSTLVAMLITYLEPFRFWESSDMILVCIFTLTTTKASFMVRHGLPGSDNGNGSQMYSVHGIKCEGLVLPSWWPHCKCKGTNGGAPARNALHVFHPPASWKGENMVRVQPQITVMLLGKRLCTAYTTMTSQFHWVPERNHTDV